MTTRWMFIFASFSSPRVTFWQPPPSPPSVQGLSLFLEGHSESAEPHFAGGACHVPSESALTDAAGAVQRGRRSPADGILRSSK